jgi:ParB-like chromosome segregation protein Spo0J
MADEIKKPFDPNGGEFAENIRNITGDDTALRESMQRAGWIKHLPAFTDENGIVIVGHRRLKIAKELGIKPVIHELTFGKGDAGDAKRLQLAIASNTGGKGLTQGDRKRIATYLYTQQNWKQQEIADAMNVSQKQISRDLEGLDMASKPPRPKGGRPKGSGKSRGGPKPERRTTTSAVEQTAASLVLDQKKSYEEAADACGLQSVQTVKTAVAREEGRRDPNVDPSKLPLTAQQKFDAAVRPYKAKLDANFIVKVEEEVRKRIDEIVLPHWKEKIAQAQKLYERRRGLMDKETFNTIRRALHPDSRQSISDKKLGEAFDTFMGLEKYLLDEKSSPTDLSGLPNSWAEWEAAKRKATEERRAARRSGNKSEIRRQ